MSHPMESDARPRFYGIYRGKVVSTSDPQNKSRIKAAVPQVLGKAVTNWADACTPVTDNTTHTTHTGTLTTSSGGDPAHTHTVGVSLAHSAHTKTPTVGQHVWLMFEGGDPDFPVWIGILP
jgi:hypothetical protein